MQFIKGLKALYAALSRRAKGAALSAWEVRQSLIKSMVAGGGTSHTACAQGAPWGWRVYYLASLAQGGPLGHMKRCGLVGAGGGHWCCYVSCATCSEQMWPQWASLGHFNFMRLVLRQGTNKI
jgi:hypothetical protein